MVTEATPSTSSATDVEALNKALAEAQAKVQAAESEQASKGPALFKANDYDGLAALNAPVKSARAEVQRIERQIEAATRESRWASTAEARKPALDILNGLIKAKPMAPIIGVKGRIQIVDDEEQQGDATVAVRRMVVSLTPVVEKVDLDAFEQQIAEACDVAAWDAAGITDVTVTLSGIGTDNKLDVVPTANLNSAGKAASGNGTKAGAKEYSFNGTWYNTRAFLEALEAAGHESVEPNERGFDVALREPDARKEPGGPVRGNGMANLASRIAKQHGFESRTKEAAAK